MKRLKSDIWTQIDELSDRTSIGANGKDRDLSISSHDQSLGIFTLSMKYSIVTIIIHIIYQ